MGRMQKGIRREVVLKPKRSPWEQDQMASLRPREKFLVLC